MDYMAAQTGGHAFYDTNGLKEHIAEVAEEARSAYTLGYYVGDDMWDGKYHNITVQTKRTGLEVRCRKGYLAADDSAKYDGELALKEAGRARSKPPPLASI